MRIVKVDNICVYECIASQKPAPTRKYTLTGQESVRQCVQVSRYPKSFTRYETGLVIAPDLLPLQGPCDLGRATCPVGRVDMNDSHRARSQL